MENINAVEKYHGLSPFFKTVIQLLAVQVFEFRQKDMIYCLTVLGFSDSNEKLFVQKTIQPIVNDLAGMGIILKKPQGLLCPESIRPVALVDVVRDDNYDHFLTVILETSPLKKNYDGSMLFRNLKDFYRLLQMSVLSKKRTVNVAQLYQEGQVYFSMEFRETPPLLKLFNRPFYPELFDSIPPDLAFKTLVYLLESAGSRMEPAKDSFEYVLYLFPKVKDMVPEKSKMLELLLYRGDIKSHKKYLKELENHQSYYHSGHQGWAMMICNKNKKALEHFNSALDVLKKGTRKKNVFFEGNMGLFFLFALLKSRETASYKAALIYIDQALKTGSEQENLLKALKSIFRDLLGIIIDVNESADILYYSIRYQQDAIQLFLNVLVLSWANKKKAAGYIDLLERIKERSVALDNLWFQAEVSALLADLGHNPEENQKLSVNIHQQCGTKTITAIVKPVPQWEKILNSLIRMGEGEQKELEFKETSSSQRLIWILFHSEKYNSGHIAPRLQKLSKKGTWTKGRAVGLKNLRNNYQTMEGLTDQDRQVASTIMEYSYRSGYRGYYDVEYIFDEKKVFSALVGHPLLFLEGSLESPVELFMGEPEVRLRMQKGKMKLFIHPLPPETDDSVRVIRETPTRFKVVFFSSKHANIARILGRTGIELPKKAKKMAGQAVTSIASFVQVNSDLAVAGSAHAKQTRSDVTPHVHIMPWQDGISIEVFTRPFADTGSYFKAGRGGSTVFAEIDGAKVQTMRNLENEKEKVMDVIGSCPTLELLEPVGGQWLIDDPETALELLLELKDCKKPVVLEWPRGEKIKVRSTASFGDFSLHLKKEREWFEATGTLDVDKDLSIDLVKLMKLLDNPSGRFVTLDDGTFLAITQTLKKRLDELKAYSTPHGKGLRIAPLAVPAIEELTEKAGSLKSDKAWKEHCKKLKEVVTSAVPGTLQARLRDYQVNGFKWLAQLAHWDVGACLADDMGLGKTIQALAAILLNAGKGPSLVVAPLSVMGNWQDECKKFAPTLNPLVFGPGNRKNFIDGVGPFDIVISSYGLLQVEAENLSGVKWQTLVLDEAQAIKNMKTKRSKAAMKLNAAFRVITTGTPVENHLDELCTLFNFLNPGLLGGFEKFKNTFAIPIERDQDKEAAGRLRKLIRPFILRRLKPDVLKELPEKTEITLKVEMSRDEALLYEAQRLKAIENIENAEAVPGAKHLRILAELTRLRQICCNPALVLPDANLESSKLKVFGNVVEELVENKHKALVFSQFVGHLSILKKFLDKKNISYQYLDGSTPAKARKERIAAFQNGEGDLFLISLKAGGFGLNLTAADYVIHMDPWWNPAVEDQASDRAHRIGQTRPVTVYRLVVKDTIEERIVKLHQEKRDLAQRLLAGSDTAGKLTANDLLKLLQGKR
ncbi:MAG: DEAD/DEAH box helicase [Desulfobacula sp.]|jgi:superfamily II DNA or RNA helicase/tetratricopeptide (TPR) repeat protein|nr:DEAD/DEAH box helicase [Desulfobacula sp.]